MAIEARANQERVGLGIAMMLLAYLLFSVVDTSVKWLALGGLSAMQLAFMRYAGHFGISLWLVGRGGGLTRDRLSTTHPWTVFLRSYLLVVSTALNFIALGYLSLTINSAIMFSAPIIVCALSAPLLGEHVGPWRWFAILVGFGGVLIVMRPFGETFHWAALLSFHNAAAMALYSILTRKLSGIVATETMQFYMGALGTFALLPLAIWTWQWPESGLSWALFLLLGVWGFTGHELLTRAHGMATANTLMPYSYSFMIYLTIAGFLVFGTVPDRWTFVGAGIVMVSGLMIWWRTGLRG